MTKKFWSKFKISLGLLATTIHITCIIQYNILLKIWLQCMYKACIDFRLFFILKKKMRAIMSELLKKFTIWHLLTLGASHHDVTLIFFDWLIVHGYREQKINWSLFLYLSRNLLSAYFLWVLFHFLLSFRRAIIYLIGSFKTSSCHALQGKVSIYQDAYHCPHCKS